MIESVGARPLFSMKILVAGIVASMVMWFAVLPLIDLVMLNLNPVIFLAAHLMWGGALGWINRVTKSAR